MKNSFRADDPIHALIAEILAVVPVSAWQFARFTDGLVGDRLLVYPESPQPDLFLGKLHEEFRLQRRETPKGPRLSAMLSPLTPPYVAGVSLVFADMRREFGILTLERTADLGPFTSFEIQAFAFALDASIDRLSGFTVTSSVVPHRPFRAFSRPAMHVLDLDLNVVLTFATPFAKTAVLSDIPTEPCQRLPDVIATVIAELTSEWTEDTETMVAGTARPLSFLTVRTQPLSGPAGTFVGVLLEPAPYGNVFDAAAQAFRLSPRELETFALLLQGAEIKEIAATLNIVPATVQDHIKSMLVKTGARNRSDMIGKLLRPPG